MINMDITSGVTVVVLAVLFAVICGVIFVIIRDKKKGKSSCGCGCGSCPMNGTCHEKTSADKPK